MVGHGWYWRKPKGLAFDGEIGVRRWRCQSCLKTMSCLPHFLLPYRHYVVVVVTSVLVRWLEQGGSWSELVATIGAEGTPAVRTMQRWVKAFEKRAPGWIRRIGAAIATQDPHHPWTEPRGPTPSSRQTNGMPTRGGAGAILLDLAIEWLAWGQKEWPELAELKLADRLSFLGIWGSDRGPGRLL